MTSRSLKDMLSFGLGNGGTMGLNGFGEVLWAFEEQILMIYTYGFVLLL